eukprot:gene1419-biopygen1281
MLKSGDGRTAVSAKCLGAQCIGQTLLKHKQAITTGMQHLYPYICETVPQDMQDAEKYYQRECNRALKQEYRALQPTGPLDEHTRRTKLTREQPEALRKILDDWRSAGVTEQEIRNRFSLHPLTKAVNNRDDTEEPEGQEEHEPATGEAQRDVRDNRWSCEIDEKRQQANIHLAQPGQPDCPVKYHATRQYMIDPNDSTTQVTQYQTEWRNRDGSSSITWSDPRTLESIHVETFEDEVASLLISTEVFASPLNVHHDTTKYFSKYERDRIFGSWGSAWEADWGTMGAFQFNPEYTPEDLKKALSFAIAATSTEAPVFGVGIYPTYEKTPYRRQFEKHKGHRVHELLEIKEGQFTFLPPDHWMGEGQTRPKQCNWGMRILVVANRQGWERYCTNSDAAANTLKQAVLSCPQSRVKEVEKIHQQRRPASPHDTAQPAQPLPVRAAWKEPDCVIDTRPWQEQELPLLKTQDIINEHNGTMCMGCTQQTLRRCEECEHVQEVIDMWWKDAGNHKGGSCHYWEYGPGRMGEKWDMTKPSVLDTIQANTEHTKLERQRSAMDRWDHIGRKTPVYDPTGYIRETEQRPRESTHTTFTGGDQTTAHAYIAPERAHSPMEYIYTDGSRREIETDAGGKEWAPGAAIWDPRQTEPQTERYRWEGQDQSVNKAELIAIHRARMRPADKAAKQACEDGEYIQPWDNDETLLLQALATDQDGVKYLLKGKNAVQTHVTKMIREANANEPAVQRWNRTLTGEPTEWVRSAPPNTRTAQRTQEQELEDMLELEREGQEDMEQEPPEGEDEALMEMVGQQTAEVSADEREREQRHQMVAQEEERREMLEDPRPRTSCDDSRAKRKETTLRQRRVTIPNQTERTDEWLNEHMKELVGDKPIHKLSNEHWKQASFAERKTVLKSRNGVLPLQSYEAAKAAKTPVTDCPLEGCRSKRVTQAKGVYVKPGHPLGGYMDHEMCNMKTARADAQAAVVTKELRNSRKGGCQVYAYTGNRTETDRKPRAIPDWILTRGHCRRDGKDHPARGDGPDTILSFVDIVMLEGTQGLKEGDRPTQAEALAKVKMIHLIELTCTDDQYWEAALLEKWRKYGPLLQLLKDHGHKAQLHVMAVGRTGTVYEHNKRALNKMGMNNKEAEKTLRNLSKTTVGYANSLYWLYRKRMDEQRKRDNAQKKDLRIGQDHPT